MAKVSPKIAKQRPFLDFFRVYQYSYDSKELLWSLSTPYKCLTCAISSKSYDWDSSESERKSPNPTPLPHMRLWFDYTCDKQVLWESAGAFLSARQLSFQPASRIVQAFVV